MIDAIQQPKQRLQWLDALRGFTMVMVVTNHVYGQGFDTNTKYSMFMSLCLMFRMPLFFFISGFLAYKASFTWDLASTSRLLNKKLRVQIIPTLVFMTAHIALCGKVFWEGMQGAWESPTKGGYWFTLVLLQMFIVYYAVCFFVRWLNRTLNSDHTVDESIMPWLVGLWLISVVGYATMYMPSWFKWPKDYIWRTTSITELVRYMQFFLLGNIVHRCWYQSQKLMDSKWFFPLLILLAFLGSGDYLKWHNLRLQWANLPRTLAMYSLVMITVCFFRHYASWFTKDTRIGSTLQYIGVRTLDIYLLHYFFFPNMPEVGKWFRAHLHNFAIEGSVGIALAAIVIAFSLLTSHVLRVSPFLCKWLFGREQK